MATKKLKTPYIVSLAYIGECCREPHPWVAIVMASNQGEARRKMVNKAKRRGYDCNLEMSTVAVPLTDFVASYISSIKKTDSHS